MESLYLTRVVEQEKLLKKRSSKLLGITTGEQLNIALNFLLPPALETNDKKTSVTMNNFVALMESRTWWYFS